MSFDKRDLSIALVSNSSYEGREVGPGDYDVPRMTGNQAVPVSNIKTPPHYSFSKTGLRDNVGVASMSNQTLLSVEQSVKNQYNGLRSSYLSKTAILHPGVGDYKLDCYETKQAAPRATIGNDRRFKGIPVLQAYKPALPSSYQVHTLMSPRSKLGKFSNEKRFARHKEKTPGPGAYRTEMYKSLSKDDMSVISKEHSVSPRL